LQQITIWPAIPDGSAVIDVRDGKTAGSPELFGEVESVPHRSRGAPVDHHEERWTFIIGNAHRRIGRRIVEQVCRATTGGLEPMMFGNRHGVGFEAEFAVSSELLEHDDRLLPRTELVVDG